jgi:ubiquitin-protein ligase E3 D
MSTTRILLYAELLSNIRQVSVAATLPSAADQSTKATVLGGGTRVRVQHGSCSAELDLPGTVAASIQLPIERQQQSQGLSWRLPLAPNHTARVVVGQDLCPMPWNASDLEPGLPVSCRKCGSIIVSEGRIESWKDLPSENWAEMMEFWHCHKPDHGKDHEHLTTKGYGARSMIGAQPSVGFVDLTSFLFSEADVLNVEVSFALLVYLLRSMQSGKSVGLKKVAMPGSCLPMARSPILNP